MSPEYLAVTMFIGVIILVFAGVPLYLALGGLGLYFGIAGGWSPQVYDQFINRIFGLMSSEVLPAVPLFVFMGAILDKIRGQQINYSEHFMWPWAGCVEV